MNKITNLEPDIILTDIIELQATITGSETQQFEFGGNRYSIQREHLSNGKAILTIKMVSDQIVTDGVFEKKLEEIRHKEINETDPLFWL